ELLDESVRAFPDDVAAREARGEALGILGRRQEALADFESALARAPGRERCLQGAALLAQSGKETDKALDYWRRPVEVSPFAPAYRGNLALLLAGAGAWGEAREHCRAWLRLDPGSIEARKLWVRCLLQQGDRPAARAEMERIQRLR